MHITHDTSLIRLNSGVVGGRAGAGAGGQGVRVTNPGATAGDPGASPPPDPGI